MSGFNVQLQLAGVLEWMSQQMAGCGGKTAVIGISGGKDSSTVAAMAVAAYGRDHVYGVLMPDGIQPDIDYSQALVEHLQIPHCTCNIHDAVAGVLSQLEQAGLTPSRQTVVNLPSRIRMATLYAVAQSVEGGIVLNTSNLSEDWVGYCTVYGDAAGAFSPLGMYTTEEGDHRSPRFGAGRSPCGPAGAVPHQAPLRRSDGPHRRGQSGLFLSRRQRVYPPGCLPG